MLSTHIHLNAIKNFKHLNKLQHRCTCKYGTQSKSNFCLTHE